MAQVICRCGESLDYDPYGPERIVCPSCDSKIRVRRRDPDTPPEKKKREPKTFPIEDGYVRFPCPCGRRLKIRAKDRPEAGRCPDCGRVVPVPDSTVKNPFDKKPAGGLLNPDDQPTGELSPEDLVRLDNWTRHWQTRKKREPALTPGDRSDEEPTPAAGAPIVGAGVGVASRPSAIKIEAGLRVCPRCGKPVHLGASNCRECGAAVPKR